MDKDMLKAIRKREIFSDSLFNVKKILNYYEMEAYGEICIDRILNEIGIDDKTICIDLDDGSVLLTLAGILRCRKVLVSYLNDDQFEELERVCKTYQEGVVLKNNLIWFLRHQDVEKLKEMKRDIKKEGIDNKQDQDRMIGYICAELNSRKITNKIWITLEKMSRLLYTYVKYHWYFKLRKELQDEIIRDESLSPRRCYNREYLFNKIYSKYLEKRSELKDCDLKRYVFYGVKSLNKDKIRKSVIKSCFLIEDDYKARRNIITAISSLTPSEFISIFPPDKKFDGDKYGEKDYFTTMAAVRRIDQNKPLGENVTYFMENYMNHDVFLFWVNWFCCIGDYSIHCGEPGPIEEYWEQLKSFSD